MGTGIGRGITVLVGVGLLGSAAAAVATVHVAWPMAPFLGISAVFGLLWGAAFIRSAIPQRAVPPVLRQRLQAMVEEASARAGIAPPRVVVSTRAIGASVSVRNGRARIVFPEVWVEKLSDAQLRACVLHELAHVRQPEMQRLSRRAWSSLIASWNLGLGVAALLCLFAPGGLGARRSLYIVYALVPLVLHAAACGRRLVNRRRLMAMEYDADRQAVDWGVPAELLTATLDALRGAEFEVRQPWDQRLPTLLALYHVPRGVLVRRRALLQAG